MDLEKHEPSAVRASDADRDRISDILRDALADGRLTAEEHSERIDSAYAAKTLGELEPLVRDLPAAGPHRPVAPAPAWAPPTPPTGPVATENLVAVFSSSTRRGRWRPGVRTRAVSVFGSVEIDLTEAVFEQQHIEINATSVFGNVEVRVPENITLRGFGTGVFGNFEVRTNEDADPQAPVVFIRGFSVFGNIEARPKRGKRLVDLHDRLRKHIGH
ncbi:DUF1707 domain-containing protein [Streptomyces sp. NPDC051219]|uniref:DUF1707 SHOCT-like domain-containing protein n=1 Tax=Streptomyces sp. NPDC051219 TaxID=3155283 RepID=UPI003418A756